ncbi:MAG TPA: hypothetical protein V6C97_08515 [Oculatellaceae cyanobacterium]
MKFKQHISFLSIAISLFFTGPAKAAEATEAASTYASKTLQCYANMGRQVEMAKGSEPILSEIWSAIEVRKPATVSEKFECCVGLNMSGKVTALKLKSSGNPIIDHGIARLVHNAEPFAITTTRLSETSSLTPDRFNLVLEFSQHGQPKITGTYPYAPAGEYYKVGQWVDEDRLNNF